MFDEPSRRRGGVMIDQNIWTLGPPPVVVTAPYNIGPRAQLQAGPVALRGPQEPLKAAGALRGARRLGRAAPGRPKPGDQSGVAAKALAQARSMSWTDLGAAWVRTSGAPAVTTTSSSIRMPSPRRA